MALVAHAARSYYADFAQTWSYLQGVYTKQNTDTTNLLITRRSFFRNGVLTIIAQVDHQPESRTPMLASLSDYIDLAGSADGLEFVHLSLINAANIDHDQAAFDNAVAVWKANAAAATVAGAGPMGFYDLTSRRMAIYNDTEAQIVRKGNDLVYGSDIAKALLAKASIVVDDPYGFANASVAKREQARRARRHGPPHLDLVDRQDQVSEKAVWEAGAVAVGSFCLEVAAVAALFPSPDPVSKGGAAIFAVVGSTVLEAVAVYDFVDKLQTFESQSAPIDSTTTVSVPDGSPVLDQGGDMCVPNPDVDSSGSFDTSPDGGVSGGP